MARLCTPPSAIRAWPVQPTASSGRTSCGSAISTYISFLTRVYVRGLRHGHLCSTHRGLARLVRRTDFVLGALEQGVARAPACRARQPHPPCNRGSQGNRSAFAVASDSPRLAASPRQAASAMPTTMALAKTINRLYKTKVTYRQQTPGFRGAVQNDLKFWVKKQKPPSNLDRGLL